MRNYSLAIAGLLATTIAPVATAVAQSSDEPVVLMTLDDGTETCTTSTSAGVSIGRDD